MHAGPACPKVTPVVIDLMSVTVTTERSPKYIAMLKKLLRYAGEMAV
jgi:hypothetical protein